MKRFDIARRLRMNSIGIGIEWFRIEPSKDIGITSYRPLSGDG
jgi:hypothetical protein